jgi:hypothetical protein
VPDDKPYEIKVKYSWDSGSPTYTFNPKDNIVLQISRNRRLINTSLILFISGLILVFVISYFYENGRFILIFPIIAPFFVALHQIIRRNKFFVIQEVPKSEKLCN